MAEKDGAAGSAVMGKGGFPQHEEPPHTIVRAPETAEHWIDRIPVPLGPRTGDVKAFVRGIHSRGHSEADALLSLDYIIQNRDRLSEIQPEQALQDLQKSGVSAGAAEDALRFYSHNAKTLADVEQSKRAVISRLDEINRVYQSDTRRYEADGMKDERRSLLSTLDQLIRR